MAIEINGNVPSPGHNNSENSRVNVGRGDINIAKQSTGKPVTIETVTLTETASQLNQLENLLAKLPVVDANRVEGVKSMLMNGTYEINYERLAAKFFSFELEMRNL